ncbi:MAG: hypothetical protein AB7P40_14790 [Chloroflexota bacterium]
MAAGVVYLTLLAFSELACRCNSLNAGVGVRTLVVRRLPGLLRRLPCLLT